MKPFWLAESLERTWRTAQVQITLIWVWIIAFGLNSALCKLPPNIPSTPKPLTSQSMQSYAWNTYRLGRAHLLAAAAAVQKHPLLAFISFLMERKMEHKDILQKVKCSRRNAVGLEESMKQSGTGAVERAGGAWRGCTGFCCLAADVLFQLTWKRECEGWAGGKVRKRFYGRRWSLRHRQWWRWPFWSLWGHLALCEARGAKPVHETQTGRVWMAHVEELNRHMLDPGLGLLITEQPCNYRLCWTVTIESYRISHLP